MSRSDRLDAVTFSLDARRYFAFRAISTQVAWNCGVREDHGHLVWPTVDADGVLSPRRRRLADGPGPKVRGLAGRSLGVWWPAGRPSCPPHDVLVCEGESDALAAVSVLGCGSDVAVAAIPGASFPARRLSLELLAVGVSVVAFAFDGDLAGGEATDRVVEQLVQSGVGVRVLAVPPGEDLGSLLGASPNPERCLRKALLAAEPRSVDRAALVAENSWLRSQLVRLSG